MESFCTSLKANVSKGRSNGGTVFWGETIRGGDSTFNVVLDPRIKQLKQTRRRWLPSYWVEVLGHASFLLLAKDPSQLNSESRVQGEEQQATSFKINFSTFVQINGRYRNIENPLLRETSGNLG
ncbi:hypothetical protein V6N11_017441 [Hibiscus sabdariffa]|uniref:Uncharacterized protein n=1 Tax=Hibiscus sabdariffa TaxID=183260 RepID=A0ABR2TYI8_9ROSI